MTRLTGTLIAFTALLTILEVVLPSVAPVPPGTSGVFGIVGCLLLIAVSKLLGKAWLQRPEDHDE
jgi:hypothetical protein